MLVNQHIYGAYGYIAPILHLQRKPGQDMFDTYTVVSSTSGRLATNRRLQRVTAQRPARR